MRKFSILLSVVLMLALWGTASSFAEEAALVDSGTVTDTINWSLDSEGILTLSGTGALPGYRSSLGNTTGEGLPPWKSYRADIRKAVVGEGITDLSARLFSGCIELTAAELPEAGN